MMFCGLFAYYDPASLHYADCKAMITYHFPKSNFIVLRACILPTFHIIDELINTVSRPIFQDHDLLSNLSRMNWLLYHLLYIGMLNRYWVSQSIFLTYVRRRCSRNLCSLHSILLPSTRLLSYIQFSFRICSHCDTNIPWDEGQRSSILFQCHEGHGIPKIWCLVGKIIISSPY